jgi:hypothetical protein
MLPSSERRQFAEKVHALKRKALHNMVMDGQIPLRQGIDRPACCAAASNQ